MTKRITFQGLQIVIENPAGSTRSGTDGKGNKWSTVMTHDYGEVIGSEGVDGDPVDVFIGPNKSAKFVYGIYQGKKDGTGFDEQKFMMGFDSTMDAKQAYYKNYDLPDQFYLDNVEAIPLQTFKKKVMESKSNPVPIHASAINTAIALYEKPIVYKPRSLGCTTMLAEGLSSGGPGIGEAVSVDGFHGRGVIVRINKRNITVKFRSGLYVTRDVGSVHALSDNYYKSRYMTTR